MYREFCTYFLILMNVIVFFMIRSEKIEAEDLMMSYHMVFNRREYYRLVSSGFAHREPMHLLFNMISLYNIGTFVENVFGHFSFLLIYFGSLIFGHILSLMIKHNNRNDYALSLGASGAICGIMGAYFLVILYVYGFRGMYDLLRPLLSLIMISILPGVDGTSHFSCMAVGMAISFIIIRFL